MNEDTDFEQELAALRPLPSVHPDAGLKQRIDLECALLAARPVAPSELLRERIAKAIGEEETREASPSKTAPSIPAILMTLGALAAAIAVAAFVLIPGNETPPIEVVETPPQTIDAPPSGLTYTPVSAKRTYIGSTDGGIEQFDGKLMHVVYLDVLDEVEYQKDGRRVIIERPARQTVYNQLAFH